MSDKSEDKVLDVLFEEYKRSAGYTHEIESHIEKSLVFGLA